MTRVTDPLLDHLGRVVRQEIFPVGLVIDGRYEIRHRIARGGMGEIFHAWDTKLDRPVAMKVLARELGSPEWSARFEAESQTTASLDHPGVVPIYDRGFLPDARLYFTMKLIEGRTLDEVDAPPSRRMELLALAGEAVGHAHERGVIHRDLKPANIMVDEAGRVYVLDWGIARVREEYRCARAGEGRTVSGTTSTGRVLGTVEYMAPEQARGDSAAVDQRCDVYALGAILRTILAGRPSDHELEAVCRKALDPNPAKRYPSAREFSQDLRRYLNGEPVTALRRTLADRAWRGLGRRRRALSAVAVGALAVAAIAVYQVRRFREQRRHQLEERRLTESRDREHREALRLVEEARAVLEQARIQIEEGRIEAGDALPQLNEAASLANRALAKAPDLAVVHDLAGQIWDLRGCPEQAEAEWRAAVAADAKYAPARLRLGRLLVLRAFLAGVAASSEERESRRLEAERLASLAEKEISCALTLQHGTGDEFLRDLCEAMLAYTRRNLEEVRRCCERGLRLWYRSHRVDEFRWLLSLALKGEEQRAALDSAVERRPRFALALFSRGVLRHERKDLRGAAADYAASVASCNRFAEAHNNLGAVLRESGEYAKAATALDMALAIRPNFFEARTNRAAVRRILRDWEGAQEDFDVAMALRPFDPLVRYNRGVMFHELGDFASALRDYGEALRFDPKMAEAYFNRGLVLRALGELEAADRDLRLATALRPADARARFVQGELAVSRELWAEAAKAFEEACRLAPEFVEAFVGLGTARRRLRDPRGAIGAFTEALRLQPRLAEAWFERAAARREAEDSEGALRDLEEALRYRPEMVEARVARGELRTAAGDLSGALVDFDVAIRLQPQDPALWYNRGVLRQLSGDWEGSVADYTEAIRRHPPYLEAHLHRGRVRRFLGDHAGAIADLRRALELAPPGWPHRVKVEFLLQDLETR